MAAASTIENALATKARGNGHFRAGRHAEAAREFSAAIAKLERARAEPGGEAALVLATCTLNRAAAELQQLAGDADPRGAAALAQRARDDCSASLAILGALGPPQSALCRKALFRRALAHDKLGAGDAALADLASVVGAQARAGERPSEEAMGFLCRLLATPTAHADDALAGGVEALLSVLACGLENVAEAGAAVAGAPASPGDLAPAPAVAIATSAAGEPAFVTPEHKWQAYTSLLAVLTERSGGRSAPMRAFLACGGPRLAHLHLHSMEGDWMADAKRGTLRVIDALLRLPTVHAAGTALELSPNGLHAPTAEGVGLHGPGCHH